VPEETERRTNKKEKKKGNPPRSSIKANNSWGREAAASFCVQIPEPKVRSANENGGKKCGRGERSALSSSRLGLYGGGSGGRGNSTQREGVVLGGRAKGEGCRGISTKDNEKGDTLAAFSKSFLAAARRARPKLIDENPLPGGEKDLSLVRRRLEITWRSQ